VVGSIFLPVRKSYPTGAPASRHEPDLGAAAQPVDGEKYLLPREIGGLAPDFFKVTDIGFSHNAGYEIFYGRLLCHALPARDRNELL